MTAFLADGAFERSLSQLLAVNPDSGEQDLDICLTELHQRLGAAACGTAAAGKGWDHDESALVEAIRVTAEWMAWGERANLPSLEALQRHNMLEAFCAALHAGSCPHVIKVQVLQSLSILVPQLQHRASIVYLLSVLNSSFEKPPDLEDEELLAYFVTILKGLAIHLDSDTVQHCLVSSEDADADADSDASLEEKATAVGCLLSFRRPSAGAAGRKVQVVKKMPLFHCAVSLVRSKDSMVQTAARTAVLMVLRFEQPAVRDAVREAMQDVLVPNLARLTKETEVSQVRWRLSDLGAAVPMKKPRWSAPAHPRDLIIEFIRLHEVRPVILKLLPRKENWHFKNMSDACVALEQMLQPRMSEDLLEFIEELFALKIPALTGALQLQGFSVDPAGKLFMGGGGFSASSSPAMSSKSPCMDKEEKAVGYRYLGLPDGLVLTVNSATSIRGSTCCVWTKVDDPGQKWRLTADGHLECMSGFFLAVPQDSTEPGTKLCIWDHRAQNGQRWALEADGHLRNGHAMYMAVSANREGVGQKVIVWTRKHEFGQTWAWQN